MIHSEQTAYVKDRYVGESMKLINGVLEFTDHEKTEAILFSANFEKAYDSIDHSFLFLLLSALDSVMSLHNEYEPLLIMQKAAWWIMATQ